MQWITACVSMRKWIQLGFKWEMYWPSCIIFDGSLFQGVLPKHISLLQRRWWCVIYYGAGVLSPWLQISPSTETILAILRESVIVLVKYIFIYNSYISSQQIQYLCTNFKFQIFISETFIYNWTFVFSPVPTDKWVCFILILHCYMYLTCLQWRWFWHLKSRQHRRQI